MKKILSVLLGLVLVLGLAGPAMAAPFYLEAAGVTIEVPEGMTAEDASTEEAYALGVTVDDDPSVVYMYSLGYNDEWAGLTLETMSEEQLNELGAGVEQSIENPSYSDGEVNGYAVLVVASGDGTQAHYISVLNGWICDVAVMNVAGEELTEEQIQPAAEMLTSITFDVDQEEAGEADTEE